MLRRLWQDYKEWKNSPPTRLMRYDDDGRPIEAERDVELTRKYRD